MFMFLFIIIVPLVFILLKSHTISYPKHIPDDYFQQLKSGIVQIVCKKNQI